MDNQEIDKMEAGQALDILIHEQVMGECAHVLAETERPGVYRCGKCNAGGFDFMTDYAGRIVGVHNYSTEIKDAFRVTEKLRAFSLSRHSDGSWHCWHWNKTHLNANADTAPLAICRAALRRAATTTA